MPPSVPRSVALPLAPCCYINPSHNLSPVFTTLCPLPTLGNKLSSRFSLSIAAAKLRRRTGPPLTSESHHRQPRPPLRHARGPQEARLPHRPEPRHHLLNLRPPFPPPPPLWGELQASPPFFPHPHISLITAPRRLWSPVVTIGVRALPPAGRVVEATVCGPAVSHRRLSRGLMRGAHGGPRCCRVGPTPWTQVTCNPLRC